jgi:hypothetical protein
MQAWNLYRKDWRRSWVLVLLFSYTLAVHSPAFAGCIEDTEVTSYFVTLMPASDCLEAKVVGLSCVGGVELQVTNNCDTALSLPPYTDCSPTAEGPTQCGEQSAQKGETIMTRLPFDGSAGDNHIDVMGTRGTDPLTIQVTFAAAIAHDYEEEGCTVARRTNPGNGILLLLVAGFLVSLRCRSDQKRDGHA